MWWIYGYLWDYRSLVVGATFYGLSKDRMEVVEQCKKVFVNQSAGVLDGAGEKFYQAVQDTEDATPISVVSTSNAPNTSCSLLIRCPACGAEVLRLLLPFCLCGLWCDWNILTGCE